jgi:hypothetical protein
MRDVSASSPSTPPAGTLAAASSPADSGFALRRGARRALPVFVGAFVAFAAVFLLAMTSGVADAARTRNADYLAEW